MTVRKAVPRVFGTVFGVDFSGAALAGRNIWIARCKPTGGPRLRLEALDRLGDLAGSEAREPALKWLVSRITQSRNSLWAMDFPFGLPVEVAVAGSMWTDQMAAVRNWRGGAKDFGHECVRRALALGGPMHIRRETDRLVRTPFDCYHYRIIYQTFHGMRDVLSPLAGHAGTAIAPFPSVSLARADRIVIETCPASTLKRLGLPHQNYKQPAGGPLTSLRRRNRRRLIEGLRPWLEMSPTHVSRMMRNPGGDALDAAIAAVGGYTGWRAADHAAIAAHPRYAREGFVYA